jgi:hypothetical protein
MEDMNMSKKERLIALMVMLAVETVLIAGFSTLTIFMLNTVGLNIAYTVKNVFSISILVILTNAYVVFYGILKKAFHEVYG